MKQGLSGDYLTAKRRDVSIARDVWARVEAGDLAIALSISRYSTSVSVIKSVAVAFACVITGAIVGMFVAGRFLQPDPTGRGAPGDGILLLMGMGYGVLIALVPAYIFIRWTVNKAHPKSRKRSEP